MSCVWSRNLFNASASLESFVVLWVNITIKVLLTISTVGYLLSNDKLSQDSHDSQIHQIPPICHACPLVIWQLKCAFSNIFDRFSFPLHMFHIAAYCNNLDKLKDTKVDLCWLIISDYAQFWIDPKLRKLLTWSVQFGDFMQSGMALIDFLLFSN